ncbi:MAG: ribose-phosphate diphosphokinase [Gammaproteobacteria bacterium]
MNSALQSFSPDRLVAFPPHWPLADALINALGIAPVEYVHHRFPDHASLFRVVDEVAGANLLLVADLHDPDSHYLQLMLLTETLRDLGAASIGLLVPYLSYMRQDKRFNPGEGISSRYFAKMLSAHFDWLITVDPHLHRYHALGEIFSIPTRLVHAAPVIATWIAHSVPDAVLIGPDEESSQWVSDIATRAGFPYEILLKQRHGDEDVKVSLPHPERWRNHTPVLVDDIISSGRTMMAAVTHLQHAGLPPPLCVAVHGVFSDDALTGLKLAGAADVITTNTVPVPTGRIDMSMEIANALRRTAP